MAECNAHALHRDPVSLSRDEIVERRIKWPSTLCTACSFALVQAIKPATKYGFQFFSIGHAVRRKCRDISAVG